MLRGDTVMMRPATIAAALLLAMSSAAHAQTTDKNPLAQVKSMKCRFAIYASGSWAKTTQEASAQVRQPEMLSLEIDDIDTDSGSGRVTGTAGPADVTALLTISSLHFMERSVTGTLNITTVFSGEAGAKSFRAVHTRHDYLPMSLPGYQSDPSVSQHYGICDVTK
jgi:hypothetical protein